MRVLDAIAAHPLPVLDLGSKDVFAANMGFLHALMLASEPLIEDVLKRPMSGGLKKFYARHLEEERGHAQWMADDLDSMGVKPALDWRAAQVAGVQYYLVRHAPPEALLGYMAALECRPMPMEMVANLERIHGKAAMRTMRYHAEHDVEHGPALLRAIERAEDKTVIIENASLTASMLRWALGDLGVRKYA